MNQRQKIKVAAMMVAMFGFLLVILFGDDGLLDLRRLRHTHQQLIESNTGLTQENLEMYHNVDRLQNDPQYVENIARHELGMIRSNELIFTFKDEENHP